MVHPPAFPAPLAPVAAHQAYWAQSGLDRALLVQPAHYGFDHSALLDALAACPNTRGVGLADGRVSPSALEALAEAGVVALRFSDFPAPGGGIRPRRGRFLAIPTALATAGGLTSPREVQNPRWIPRKAGGWFVVGPAGVLFVLHPGPITLPAKGYLRDAVAEVVRVVPQRLPLAVLMGLEAA
jgi:hypothetical protein